MRDIEKILVLAQKAHDHLQKNNIPKAKRKLKRIIKFDLDELSRLQKEKGNKKLLQGRERLYKRLLTKNLGRAYKISTDTSSSGTMFNMVRK